MAARNPLTAKERARIIKLAKDGMSRNDICRDTSRSADTVSKTVKAAGLSFDRTATTAATEARKADLAERRARLRVKYLKRAEELLDQMDQPHLAFNFGGKDNTYEEHILDRPPVRDLKDLIQAASIATTAELRISAAVDETGVEAVRSMLGNLGTRLGLVTDADSD